MIDFEKLKALTSEMSKSSNGNQFERLEFTKVKADMKGYKLFYPAGQTKARLKILYNVQSGLVARKVAKHQFTHTVLNNGKKFNVKPPCLKQFGRECSICTTVNNIEQIKGKDILKGVHQWTGKYISFAYVEQIEGHPESDPEKKINPGEIVLFMYPSTIFKNIDDILGRCTGQGDAEKFFAQNESISFVLSVDGSKSGTDMYGFMPDPMPTTMISKMFNTPDGDQKFSDLLNSLPSLYDIYVPSEPTDEIISLNREVADELSKRYLSNNTPDATTANIIEGEIKKQEALQQIQSQQVVTPIINQDQANAQAQVVQPTITTPIQPQQVAQTTVTMSSQPGITTGSPVQPQPQVATQVSNTVSNVTPNVTPVQSQTTENSSKPECFGKFNDIDAKCLICPHSTECSTNK